MKKRIFPGISESVSLLGFGLMRLPRLEPVNGEAGAIDYELAERMVDQAIQSGVTYFDTAWGYHEGHSEEFAGKALSRHPRGSYYLASKMPVWELSSPADLERIFAEQLKRCRVEYFDFYLLHNMTEENYKKAREFSVYEFLHRKKEQGFIRHLGFSFHDHPRLLERIVTEHEWDFAQIQLNYLDWTIIDSKRQYEILQSRNLPVIVMEPVRGGSLASLTPEAAAVLQRKKPKDSPAVWAIRYAASLPGVLTVLSGMSQPEQLAENISAMSPFTPLSQDEQNALDEAGTIYKASGAIPCTACRYCMDCPSGVDIPRVFAIYNHYLTRRNEMWSRNLFEINYASLDETAQAHNCIACGLCLDKCPQFISIPEHMESIARFVAEKPEG